MVVLFSATCNVAETKLAAAARKAVQRARIVSETRQSPRGWTDHGVDFDANHLNRPGRARIARIVAGAPTLPVLVHVAGKIKPAELDVKKTTNHHGDSPVRGGDEERPGMRG